MLEAIQDKRKQIPIGAFEFQEEKNRPLGMLRKNMRTTIHNRGYLDHCQNCRN